MPSFIEAKADLINRVCDHHHRQTVDPDIPYLTACGVVPSVSQTEVWVGCQRKDGSWAVAQAKFVAHDVAVGDYQTERRGMHAGDAVRRVRRWASRVPDDHPVYREVGALAASLGTSARKNYEVLVIDEAEPVDNASEDTSERAIVAAISQLVPLLSDDGRQRVRDLIGT
jgi:hypothetical protein